MMKPEKPSPSRSNRRSDQDIDRFEALPKWQKDLQLLKDREERSSGQKKADVSRKIRRRSEEEGA